MCAKPFLFVLSLYFIFNFTQSGPDADLARKIDSDTQQDIQQMQADYERNREKVIQVLLAAVTTVHIDVAASMKVKSN